jgi:hypothetical protein
MDMTTFPLVACLLAASLAPDLTVLRSSAVREEISGAAVRVAGSGDAAALRELGDLLASAAFLARLDETKDPQRATFNVHRVFLALAKNPSAMTEALCLKLLSADAFAESPARVGYGLQALAAVRPMSPATAAVLKKMNGQGYFAFAGPLLAANGSDRAVALLESMFADRSQPESERVALARETLVPHRTHPGLVAMVSRLVGGSVEPELGLALAESLYDYRPEHWYGKRRDPPQAPSWKTAPPEARRAATALGQRLLARKDLPPALRTAIKAALSL